MIWNVHDWGICWDTQNNQVLHGAGHAEGDASQGRLKPRAHAKFCCAPHARGGGLAGVHWRGACKTACRPACLLNRDPACLCCTRLCSWALASAVPPPSSRSSAVKAATMMSSCE